MPRLQVLHNKRPVAVAQYLHESVVAAVEMRLEDFSPPDPDNIEQERLEQAHVVPTTTRCADPSPAAKQPRLREPSAMLQSVPVLLPQRVPAAPLSLAALFPKLRVLPSVSPSDTPVESKKTTSEVPLDACESLPHDEQFPSAVTEVDLSRETDDVFLDTISSSSAKIASTNSERSSIKETAAELALVPQHRTARRLRRLLKLCTIL